MDAPPADDPAFGAWRLPREIEADPIHAAIRAALASAPRPLWSGGSVVAAVVPLGEPLRTALRRLAPAGRLVRGLESAASALATEQAGLAALSKATAESQGARVSRLLLLANDGAERFYRQVERLVLAHAPRVLAVVLDADAEALGGLLYGSGAVVKLVLTTHKAATAAVLRALAAP